MVSAMGCIQRNLNRFGEVAEICLVLCLVTVAARGAQMPHAAKPGAKPDLGPNVLEFDPSMPSAAIQEQIDKVYSIQQHSEFGSARYALLFLPGEYRVDIPVGFYTQVLGLGATPDAVHITGNGTLVLHRAVPFL